MPSDHLLHGLRVRFPSPVPGAAEASGEPDLRVVDGPGGEPRGEPAAALELAGGGYEARLDGGVLRVRFHRTADFAIDPAAGTIEVSARPGGEAAMVDVLLVGNVLALALGLLGHAVLHASAVVHDGRAIAFAGASGAGKSTCAGLLCAAGAELLGDDTLRLDGATAHRGHGELRLRGWADALAGLVPGARRVTADGRSAVAPSRPSAATVPLGTVAFPRWSTEVRDIVVTPLDGRAALSRLLTLPRVTGWTLPGPVRANFAAFAAVARSVPAAEVTLPRGAPLDGNLGAELAAALRPVLSS